MGLANVDVQKGHFLVIPLVEVEETHGPLHVRRSGETAEDQGYGFSAAEIGHPQAGRIWLEVNGEIRQDADINELILNVPGIIEHISGLFILKPGDLIYTGTPAGVGMGFTPPKYLQPGDEVVVDVTGVGELRNPVIE